MKNGDKVKKTSVVHRYKSYNKWHGKKFANTKDGCWLLTTEMTAAGITGVHFIDHRRRKKVFLMSREAM